MPSVDLTRIGSNIGAMYSLQSLMNINNKLATAQQRLATGKRLNTAMDDPAGMTIASKMQARSLGLGIAQDNISDAKNMLSVAESGLSKITDILSTMRSKAQQAASDTLGSIERTTITTQLKQFATQIDDLVTQTKWNDTTPLLTGSISKQFQTGVDLAETLTWTMNTPLSATALHVSTTQAGADAITLVGSPSGTGVGVFTTTATTTHSQAAITTGTYSVKVLDMATAAQGKVNIGVRTGLPSQTVASDATASATELASGNYKLKITNVNVASPSVPTPVISYEVRDSANNIVGSETGVALVGLSTLNLKTANAGFSLGVNFNFAPLLMTNGSGGNTEGKEINFEYLAANSAKYELRDGSGGVMNVDVNASLATTTSGGWTTSAINGNVASTGSAGYYQMGAGTVDTGRGLIFAKAAVGSTAVENSSSYNILKVGTNQIDVSTAAKAGEYMDLVNTAMDTVNTVLSDLGSLMARMTIKEEAAGSARINVEAAYNRIMNANMAEEQVNASKYQVLQQTAVAMLAQANQAPQFLLSLFK